MKRKTHIATIPVILVLVLTLLASCGKSGSGIFGTSSYTCNTCGGDGTIECPTCVGRGRDICGSCDGKGTCTHGCDDGVFIRYIDCDICDNGIIVNPFTWQKFSCGKCDGLGIIREAKKCGYCKGTNKCSQCDGSGLTWNARVCQDCTGSGKIDCPDCD